MIYLIQNDREYDYDVRAIALAFYERTKIVEVTKEEFEEQEWEKDDLLLTLVYTKKRIQGWLKGKVGIEGTEERAVSEEVVCDYEDHKGSRNAGWRKKKIRQSLNSVFGKRIWLTRKKRTFAAEWRRGKKYY